MKSNLIQGRLRARIIAQPVNCLQSRRPELDSQHPSVGAHDCNWSWGGGSKRNPRTQHSCISLSQFPVRNPISKNQGGGCYRLTRRVHTRAYTHAPSHMRRSLALLYSKTNCKLVVILNS